MNRGKMLKTLLRLPVQPVRAAVEARKRFAQQVCGEEFYPELTCSTENTLLIYRGDIPIEVSFQFTPPKVRVLAIDPTVRFELSEKVKGWLNQELEGSIDL